MILLRLRHYFLIYSLVRINVVSIDSDIHFEIFQSLMSYKYIYKDINAFNLLRNLDWTSMIIDFIPPSMIIHARLILGVAHTAGSSRSTGVVHLQFWDLSNSTWKLNWTTAIERPTRRLEGVTQQASSSKCKGHSS